MYNVFANHCQDDEGDNAFHIAADAAKMIRENLVWLIVMLRNPDAAVEVRNHRQVTVGGIASSCGFTLILQTFLFNFIYLCGLKTLGLLLIYKKKL